MVRGIDHCKELIKSGLDINQFVCDPSLPSRRKSLLSTSSATEPSPILARKASVIKEWSNLQRKRALSQTEADKPSDKVANPDSINSSPSQLSALSSTTPSPLVSQFHSGTASSMVSESPSGRGLVGDVMRSGVGGGEEIGNGNRTSIGIEMRQRLLTARCVVVVVVVFVVGLSFLFAFRFEELTVSELRTLHTSK